MVFNPLTMVTGLAGAVLPLGAAKMGVGKNTTNVTDFGRTSQYDPSRFEYGGEVGGANHAANRFAQAGHDAQRRAAMDAGPAAYADVTRADYRQANGYGAQAQDARAGQAGLAGLMMGRATGAVPSLAQLQGDRAMQQAAASQASAAAGARGAGGLALAQQNAAGNVAAMQSAISNQTQQNVLAERERAEQAAYGAYSGMRGGDQAGMGQAAQMAQYQAQLGAQQNQYNAQLAQNMAQYNAQLGAQNRAQNDAYSLGLYGQENNVRQQQLTGGMNQQQLLANSMMQGQAQNLEKGAYNANREYQYYDQFGKGLTGAMSGQAMGMGSGGGQPNTGLAAPSTTGMGAPGGAQSSMVGIPQAGSPMPPPTGSDDRMKFGMSPLSMLGLGGGSSGPGASVDMGGKGYMSQGDIQAASTGLAGGGGGMPGMVGGGGVTGGNMGDLGMPGGGGGMSGGLLSDDKAKLRAVYLQGLSDAGGAGHSNLKDAGDIFGDTHLDANRSYDRQPPRPAFAGASASGSGLTDREIAARTSEAAAFDDESTVPVPASMVMSGGASLINLGRAQAERRLGLGVERPTYGVGRVVEPARDSTYEEWQRAAGPDGVRRYPGAKADPVTEQFARGLAPIQFDYRPGMGPPGRQTGVRAQQAETQPITASMITRRPDGLRQIDPAMGLGTALAGVGHLANKQREQEARLNELLGLAARREGY